MTRTLQFCESVRLVGSDKKPFDGLRLGTATLQPDGTGTVRYWSFDPRANPKPLYANVRHPRFIPTGGQPGFIELPRYQNVVTSPVRWEEAGDRLTYSIGKVVHTYTRRPDLGGHYALAGPYTDAKGKTTVDGAAYLEGRGYAAWSELATTPGGRDLARADLFDYYSAELCSLVGAAKSWTDHKPQSWRLDLFKEYGPNLYGHNWKSPTPPTDRDIFASLLLNYAPASKLVAYYNGGNDYSRDRAMNEIGHAYMLLGSWTAGKVGAMVGVELTHQTRGYPICSVVLYYR